MISFSTRHVFCFTADHDWASEDVVRHTQGMCEELGIVPTYFATNPSSVIDEAIAREKAEGGIHPNFLAGSSQGEGFDAVANYFDSFPAAYKRAFRSHRYFDVTDINLILKEKGFLFDSNLFTFMQKIPPYQHFTDLIRFPNCWEDGTHLRANLSLELGDIKEFLDQPGLSVMSVHPMHMALNSPTFQFSRDLKDRLSREEMWNMTSETISMVRNSKNRGISDLFQDIVRYARQQGYEILTLSQLYEMCR